MRLTLRTLMAYLDGILEPDDREALGRKIDESELAKKLIERTQDVVKRSRLGAPQPVGTGVARDPNSVAEYLDNTMAPEQIQDFERVCLESDLHLAEVTSAHNILTMVLGEPAEIEPATRERMYRLIDRQAELSPAPSESQQAEAARSAAATGSGTHGELSAEEAEKAAAREERQAAASAVHQVRSSTADDKPSPAPQVAAAGEAKSRFWPIALTFIIGAAAMFLILMILDSDLRRLVLGGSQPADPGIVAKNDNSPDDGPPAPPQTDLQDSTTANATESVAGTGSPTNAGDTTSGVASSGDAATDLRPVDNTTAAIDETDDLPAVPELTTDATDGAISESPESVAPTEDNGGTVEPMAETPTPESTVRIRPTTDDPSVIQPTDVTASPPMDETAVAALTEDGVDDPTSPATEDPEPEVIGRLLSQNQLLLTTRDALDNLVAVPARGTLHIGEKIVVLPTFRPMISIAATTVELEGPAMIELAGYDPAGIPSVILHYGRMVGRSLTMPRAKLQLQLGDFEGIVSFGDADSTFAAEVRPFRIAGTDPERVASHYAVDLYAANGTVIWTTLDGDETINAPSRRLLAPHPGEPNPKAEIPDWISTHYISPLDERAVGHIEQGIRPDRSVKLSLTELTQNNRTEIRRLAIRCCAHVAFFDPLVNSLSDPDMRPRWNLYAGELSQAVARSPESAKNVRLTLERLREDDAFELYRMLWGYSTVGLRDGGEARQLVEYLDHEELDFRVLSFWNLQQITGVGLNYRPEYTEVRRRQSIERWQQRLARDEILPVSPTAAEPVTPN